MSVLIPVLTAVLYIGGVFFVAVGGYRNAEKMPELAGVPRSVLTVVYILLGLLWPLVFTILLIVLLKQKARS